MTQQRRSTVVGVFEDPRQAQQAIIELRRAGFREDEIGLVTPSTGHDRSDEAVETPADESGRHVETGAVTGAVAGAGAGALWALGIVAGVLPPLGPVVAGGILASILASAAGTAVAGGIVGALIGLGVPEEEAHYYEGEFKSGRTIVTVQTAAHADEARSILQRFGAYDRSSASAAGASAPMTAHRTRAAQTMKLHEESIPRGT